MKNALYLLLFSFGLSACSSNEKTARNKIEDFIKANANDAKSYEFISMNTADTSRISDTLEQKIFLDSLVDLDVAARGLELSQEFLSDYEEKMKGPFPDIYKESYEQYKKEVSDYSITIEKVTTAINQDKKKLKEIKEKPEENKIVRVVYTLNCRLKNKIGVLNKTSVSISFFPNENRWGEAKFSE
jgi:hypothetical protein